MKNSIEVSAAAEPCSLVPRRKEAEAKRTRQAVRIDHIRESPLRRLAWIFALPR